MKTKLHLLALLLATAIAATAATAQTAYEVKPGTYVSGNAAALGGNLLFLGDDGTAGGSGLWKSDGTAPGTSLVRAISSSLGAPGSFLVPCNGLVFFAVTTNTTPTTQELWRSDGTTAGTFAVQTGFFGPSGYQVFNAVCAGRTLFFTAGNSAYDHTDLRRSDGTAAGTFVVVPDVSAPISLANVRGTLFFTVDYSGVWKTDGTASGTKNVVPATTDYQWATLVGVAGSQFYFLRNFSELWRTDGTPAGAVRLLTDGRLQDFRALAGKAMFFHDGLWTSDGTAAGTQPLRWPMALNAYSSPAPSSAVSSGRYFFHAADAGSSTETLWRSDGSAAGTSQFSALTGVQALSDADGTLFFGTAAGTWMTDGTTAPVNVSTQLPAAIVKAGTRAFIITNTGTSFPTRNKLFALDLSFAASTLAPDSVPMAGGTAVTISGTGFGAGTTVDVDGTVVAPSTITASSLTFTAPAHAAGTVDVTVTNASGQQARMPNALTYTCAAPVAVASGSTTSCAFAPVPLQGSGGTACSWLPPTGLSDPTSCTPTASPSATTTYRLTVVNASGCVSTNAADVTVTVKPLPLTMITLAMSPLFAGDSTASVPDAGAGATYQWSIAGGQLISDPTQRTVTFRNGCTTARLTITITGANGCPVTGNAGANPFYPRGITSVNPLWGPDGTPFTLTGRALDCVTAIRFAQRTLATSFHIDSPTQITTSLPAGSAGGTIEVQIDGAWVAGNASFYRTVLRKRGDVDGDGRADLVFRNPTTGSDAVWVMNGTQLASVTNVVSFPNADYHIVGVADFDRNGSNDFLLHNRATGANAIWKMSNFTYYGVVDLPAIPDTNFELEGTGDFNGDAYPDILVRNQATGANAIWLMNGGAVQSTVNLPALPNGGYRMAGTGDFNADGNADIVWRNAATGANAVWLMNGTAYSSTLNLPALPNSNYAIGGIADYNGDGKPDLAWRNASTGANALWLLDGGTLLDTINLPQINIPEMEMAGPR